MSPSAALLLGVLGAAPAAPAPPAGSAPAAASPVAPAAAGAAGRRPFGVDDLLALDRVGEPALSPDGRWVAFTVARAAPDGARLLSSLWLVPAAGGAPRRLTHGEERVRAPRFSPDGTRLAFVAARGGGAPRVHVLPLDGGEAVPAPAVPGGAQDYLWTPDGRALVVLAEVAPACGADLACNERADAADEGRPYASDRLLYRHWDTWRRGRRVHLLRVPLDGGPAVDLTPGDRDAPPNHRGDVGDVAVSPDGTTLYFAAVTDPVEALSTNADLFAAPLSGGEARQLTRAPGWDGSPRPSPDGRWLAWLRQPRAGYEADRRHVLVARPDGTGERDLTATLDLSAEQLWWVDGGRALRFTATQAGRTVAREIDVASGRVADLGLAGVHLAGLAPSRDGRTAAALVDSLLAPPEVALLAPARGGALAVTRLTRFGAAVMDRVLPSEVRSIEGRAADGTRVPGWLVLPPGHRPGARHPAVVLVHGGPQGAWNDAWTFRWNALLWAANGWAVVLPNPRGSTGYGQAFTDAVRREWGGAPYGDVMAVTDAAVGSGAVDGERMCAAGASYGGYMVFWIAGQTDRFRCLVAHAGVFDLEMGYYDTEELWFPEWEQGIPWEDPAAFDRYSPNKLVARWKTPMLVTHGERDYRVAVTQGLAAFTALQRRGIESRLLVFPDENHWILKPRNSRVFHEEVFGWVGRHLGAAKSP